MFKVIPGWEGLYEVNEDAVIRSAPRNGNGFKPHIMAQSTDSDGYLVFKARNGEKVRTIKVHRAVAMAFLPNPENKPQVNHKNGNKKNCKLWNLEWVTASENIRHAKLHGLQCECPNRVQVAQVDLMTEQQVNVFKSLRDAELNTGIGWTGISAVLRGKRHSAGGFYWKRIA